MLRRDFSPCKHFVKYFTCSTLASLIGLPILRRVGLLSRMFSGAKPVLPRADWPTLIGKISLMLSQIRADWWDSCLKIWQKNGLEVINSKLEADGEIAATVYQALAAFSFLAEKRYIAPADGQDFTTQLFAEMGRGQSFLRRQELLRQFADLLGTPNKLEQRALVEYVARHGTGKASSESAESILRMVPLLAHGSYLSLATVFGDTQTTNELMAQMGR
jgi:hypothetical protein